MRAAATERMAKESHVTREKFEYHEAAEETASVCSGAVQPGTCQERQDSLTTISAI